MSKVTDFTNEVVQPTAGEVVYYPGSTAPTGYLVCDGSVVSQSTYASLYSVLGLWANGPDNWTARTSATSSDLYSIIYNGSNLYVAAGYGPNLMTSTDAITWTARTVGANAGAYIFSLAYGNSLYVLGGWVTSPGGIIYTSTDAITWTSRTSGTTSQINAVLYGSSLYVYGADGGRLATSTNAITWTARTSGTTSAITALCYGNSLYVYGGTGGVLSTSTDAITWTARTSNVTGQIKSIIYANSLFVLGTTSREIATSTDAITWTVRTSNALSQVTSLAYGNGLYMYGDYYYVGTSTDAITWSLRSRLSGNPIVYSLTYGNGIFVYVANGGKVSTCPKYTYNTASDFILPTTSSTVQGAVLAIKT